MDSTIKKTVRRSNSYPSISIEEALELTTLINKNGGYHFIKLEDIANITKKSIGGMSQKVGSAVQYNLLEMKPGIGYRPSDLFKRISKPLSATERRQSLIAAFNSPKLYLELISKLEGNPLPSEGILTNILERDHHIYDDAAKKAAMVFLENLQDLNLRNSNDELDFATEGQQDETSEVNITNTTKPNIEIDKPIAISEQSGNLLKLEIGLTSSKKAIIYYPPDMSNLDIEIMKLQLTVLEKIVENNKAGALPQP